MIFNSKTEMDIESFILNSNAIEGIWLPIRSEEVRATEDFLNLEKITVADVEALVRVYQPDARLRINSGDDVRVENHVPVGGGQRVLYKLENILSLINDDDATPYQAHCLYEDLHPFTDCNGRSGRTLWWWHMRKTKERVYLPFLQHFYYQALENTRSIPIGVSGEEKRFSENGKESRSNLAAE